MELELNRTVKDRRTQAAISQTNMAAAQLLQGRSREAEVALREAVAVHEMLSGPDAPITQTVRNNLASALRANGKYAEAVAIIRAVNEARRRVLPEGHFERDLGDGRLGLCYLATGAYLNALPVFDSAIASSVRKSGALSEDTLLLRSARARALAAVGRSNEAQSEAQIATDAMAALKGSQHIRVAEMLVHQAGVLRDAGECERSSECAQRALQIATKAQGARHPVSLNARREIALTAAQCDPAGQSAEHLLRALAQDLAKELGPDHPTTGQVLLSLAELQLEQNSSHAGESAREAARVLALPSGVEPWFAQWAQFIAQVADRPHAAQESQSLSALKAIRDNIIALAGDQSPDLRRTFTPPPASAPLKAPPRE